MRPSQLMIIGAFGLIASIVVQIAQVGVSLSIFAFSCGMVFGKGYGIWEERSRRIDK